MGFDGLDCNSMVYMEDGRREGWDGKSICVELCRGPEYSNNNFSEYNKVLSNTLDLGGIRCFYKFS